MASYLDELVRQRYGMTPTVAEVERLYGPYMSVNELNAVKQEMTGEHNNNFYNLGSLMRKIYGPTMSKSELNSALSTIAKKVYGANMTEAEIKRLLGPIFPDYEYKEK